MAGRASRWFRAPHLGRSDDLQHVVCIGLPKCGTTMLDWYFRRTPGVAAPLRKKEIQFFLSENYPKSDQRAAYLAEFAEPGEEPPKEGYTFEASPPYSAMLAAERIEVLRRIRHTLGEQTRVVLCLRHPVDRAYSSYIHDMHRFALYGARVYSNAPRLLERPFALSFSEAMKQRRYRVYYEPIIREVQQELGAGALRLFLLEWDAPDLRRWATNTFDDTVAAAVPMPESGPLRVISRRPVPNYAIGESGSLLAFGSRAGELVEYPADGPDGKVATMLREARDTWTLQLPDRDVESMTESIFGADLRRCAELTGDQRLLDYLTRRGHSERAVLTKPKALVETHHVKGTWTPL